MKCKGGRCQTCWERYLKQGGSNQGKSLNRRHRPFTEWRLNMLQSHLTLRRSVSALQSTDEVGNVCHKCFAWQHSAALVPANFVLFHLVALRRISCGIAS